MANHVNENPYLNLSRKALQNLCKEYRLPANRSNSHLASSLASYIKDAKLLENCPPGVLSKDFNFSKDGTTKNSPSNIVGAIDADAGEHCGSLAKPVEEAQPTLEFHVWSDDGIDLFVDLDASPLHWITRFKDEFCPENVHNSKFQSFRQDICFLGENSKEKKSSSLQNFDTNESDDVHYSPSSRPLKNDRAAFSQKLKDDESLISVLIKPNSNSVKFTDNLEENLWGSPADPRCGESNYLISAAESCAKNGSGEILDSAVIDTLLMKLRCGSTGNTLLDPGKLENPTSAHSNIMYEDYGLMNSYSNVHPDMICPIGSLSDFVKPQCSEVANCPKDAAILLCENDQSGVKKERLLHSSELDLGIDGNRVALLVEESDVGKLNGKESSEYARFDNPTKKMSSQCFESKKDSCRKRKHLDDADPYAGRGRAPKLLPKKRVLELVHLRRSSRLSLKGSEN